MGFDTRILKADEEGIRLAAELLRKGEIVAIPTETVYGLAGNAFSADSARKIYAAKGRPSDNPLIVHIAQLEEVEKLTREFPEIARRCAERFWPGPLTMVLPKSEAVPFEITGGLDTVGIRFPANKAASEVIKAAGSPLAAPSANRSGRPSPTCAMHVFNDLKGRIPLIIDGDGSAVGVESTVISFENETIRLLRPGFVTPDDLREVSDNVIVDDGVLNCVADNVRVSSPGMKYKHYSPKAEVIILDGDIKGFEEYIRKNAGKSDCCVVFTGDRLSVENPIIEYGRTSEEQAAMLFSVLRELDKQGFERAYFRCPDKNGVGLAVYNRLLRAAAFRVVKL